MTRSQFFLSMTLLCVSGTLAFMVSFRARETANGRPSLLTEETPERLSSRVRPREIEPRALLLSPRRVETVDPTHYEVTVDDLALQDTGSKIERESLERLRSMTDQYQFTPNQRRQIFPLLVAHHADFSEGLIVNGFPAPSPEESTLAEQIYPLLDLTQQENYQKNLLADVDWWSDVIGQLRDDLDRAYENGEVDLITESDPVRRRREQADEEEIGN